MKPNYKNWVPKGLLIALAVVLGLASAAPSEDGNATLCSRKVSLRIQNTFDKGAYRCCRKNVLGEGYDSPS